MILFGLLRDRRHLPPSVVDPSTLQQQQRAASLWFVTPSPSAFLLPHSLLTSPADQAASPPPLPERGQSQAAGAPRSPPPAAAAGLPRRQSLAAPAARPTACIELRGEIRWVNRLSCPASPSNHWQRLVATIGLAIVNICKHTLRKQEHAHHRCGAATAGCCPRLGARRQRRADSKYGLHVGDQRSACMGAEMRLSCACTAIRFPGLPQAWLLC